MTPQDTESFQEVWKGIHDFPRYSVSNLGRVLNELTGRIMQPSVKYNGLVWIGMMRNGIQHKRSLPLLVATAFLPRPSLGSEAFDTPVNLNGDRADNRVSNLAWRPLWFARAYHSQFHDYHTSYDKPIVDVEANVEYPNSMTASVVNGVLDTAIVTSMNTNTYVWPTGQIFRKI